MVAKIALDIDDLLRSGAYIQKVDDHFELVANGSQIVLTGSSTNLTKFGLMLYDMAGRQIVLKHDSKEKETT
jgi:hypothetical protein